MTPRRQLQPGDRVRLKGFGVIVGDPSNYTDIEGVRGEVETGAVQYDREDCLRVRLIDFPRPTSVFVYSSQCVRLVKRKRREWKVLSAVRGEKELPIYAACVFVDGSQGVPEPGTVLREVRGKGGKRD